MDDRSTLDELRDRVIKYLEQECCCLESNADDEYDLEESLLSASKQAQTKQANFFLGWFNSNSSATSTPESQKKLRDSSKGRPVYLAGESFGGILALEVARSLRSSEYDGPMINMQGLTLINAATCYDRSKLSVEGPKVANCSSGLYLPGLLQLLPLFTDEYSVEQLLLILKGKALPSVIDDETREAYMGRVAFSLPFVLPFMTQETMQWRLREWLALGCARLAADDNPLSKLKNARTLIIAGEKDATLPSIAEAERLASILPDSVVHVVEGAGHASTCGSRVDLAALFRSRFPELRAPPKDKTTQSFRICMKETASNGIGAYFGMEPRYDNATIGLSPLRYWSKKYFKRFRPARHRHELNATKAITRQP